ncbi:DUF4274 domain-containing protein [Roseospira navarrensis]|nr:DUF4274 domain-containing protein [Roseospira navarrensis]
MFPCTLYSDDPEDRAFGDDLWTWLKEQPQDAWLLWMRTANWDNADGIFDRMLDDPNCDLAIVSWLFWASDPGYHLKNPDRLDQSLPGKILRNLDKGYYTNADLFYDTFSVIDNAHAYIACLEEMREKGINPLFALPRPLCGPFNGRRARIPNAYDPETEEGLRQVFEHMNGRLPRSEEAYWRDQTAGGNLAIMKYLALPKVPDDPLTAFAHLDDVGYMEAIFGRHKKYLRARKRLVIDYMWDPKNMRSLHYTTRGNSLKQVSMVWKYSTIFGRIGLLFILFGLLAAIAMSINMARDWFAS